MFPWEPSRIFSVCVFYSLALISTDPKENQGKLTNQDPKTKFQMLRSQDKDTLKML